MLLPADKGNDTQYYKVACKNPLNCKLFVASENHKIKLININSDFFLMHLLDCMLF